MKPLPTWPYYYTVLFIHRPPKWLPILIYFYANWSPAAAPSVSIFHGTSISASVFPYWQMPLRDARLPFHSQYAIAEMLNCCDVKVGLSHAVWISWPTPKEFLNRHIIFFSLCYVKLGMIWFRTTCAQFCNVTPMSRSVISCSNENGPHKGAVLH